VSKDRAAPFSRKHRRVWIPVTGGMILIGILNLAVGYCSYEPPSSEPPQKIELVIPKPTPLPDATIYTLDTLPAKYRVDAQPGDAGALTPTN